MKDGDEVAKDENEADSKIIEGEVVKESSEKSSETNKETTK
jgi:hypothetical protein